MPPVRTAGTGETVGEDAALQIAAELSLYVGWQTFPVLPTRLRELGLQVLPQDLVEGSLLGMATAVRDRLASR
jgi:hypothetical protein